MRGLLLFYLLGATFACVEAGPGSGSYPVKHMQEVATVNAAPAADDVVIVFARPTRDDWQVQWSVFEVVEEQPAALVGILGALKKVAYRGAPGRHLFMALGANGTDFVTANLEAGKLYYVLLMPGENSVSLQPVRASDHHEVAQRLAQAGWVQTTSDSLAWARENADDIEAKRFKYYGIWRRKPSFERLALFPDDGE
ncbi:MAG TPA: hypothetical protein VN903_06765 [Polyangia bacterium]|nr:hypothetical protein [Polyangia bacterium]